MNHSSFQRTSSRPYLSSRILYNIGCYALLLLLYCINSPCYTTLASCTILRKRASLPGRSLIVTVYGSHSHNVPSL